MFDKFFDEPKFDFDAERTKFISNLDLLKSMSVQEQTLYKKWQEFNKNEYNMRNKVTNFPKYYNRLWKPTDITNKELTIKEIESIEPEVVFVPSDDALFLNCFALCSLNFSVIIAAIFSFL